MASARREFLLSAGALVVAGLAPAGMGLVAKLLVDALVAGEPRGYLAGLVAAQLGLALIGGMTQHASDYWRETMRNRLDHHLRYTLAAHAAKLDLAYFEMPDNYDTFSKAKRGLGFRPVLMAYALIFAVQQCATVAGFFVVVLTFHPLLALTLVVSALPTLLAAGKSGSESYSSHDLTTPEGRRANYLESLLSSDQYAKEVRLYALSSTFLKQLGAYSNWVLGVEMAVAGRKTRRFIVADVVSVGVQYAALAFVVVQVALGRASLGDFTLLIAALAGVRGSLTQMLAHLGEVYENSLFFEDLSRFLAERPVLVAPQKPHPVPSEVVYGLALEDVTFAYPGATRPVFSNLSLTLQAGKVTALVGVNGAGKTTLVKLLTRLYDPQTGRVTLDGVDVRDFDPQEYRTYLGVILQDFARYQLSARENILLGRTHSDPDEGALERAAREAGALLLIASLPEGWQTLLGRQFHVRGQDLSGGQWQRIALARALYRNAPILLLDEPTAALDAEAEAELFRHYRALTRGRTTLLITHRFNTVRMADRILVIEGGHTVEDGTHGELLAANARYASMFNAQAETYGTPPTNV